MNVIAQGTTPYLQIAVADDLSDAGAIESGKHLPHRACRGSCQRTAFPQRYADHRRREGCAEPVLQAQTSG